METQRTYHLGIYFCLNYNISSLHFRLWSNSSAITSETTNSTWCFQSPPVDGAWFSYNRWPLEESLNSLNHFSMILSLLLLLSHNCWNLLYLYNCNILWRPDIREHTHRTLFIYNFYNPRVAHVSLNKIDFWV